MRRLALCGLCAAMVLAGCGPSAQELREQGISEFQLGRHDEAKKLLQQCLDRTPTDPRGLFYMGRVEHAQGSYDKAVFYFESCLDLDPSLELAELWLDKARAAAGPLRVSTPSVP